MNNVTGHDVLQLAIFKCIRDIHKYDSKYIPQVGQINANPIRGLIPRFVPKADSTSILLDGDDIIYGRVKWPLKTDELFITDLSFEISPRAVETEEVMEYLLIAVVRLMRDFRLKVDTL